ncbi:MAG TPA: PQQ-dependent sugar dehydrogenase [Methylophilaceae bacterium]|nr:PQQ-dependent sugar dehydrogenase [Methylophilaceae bacterium]
MKPVSNIFQGIPALSLTAAVLLVGCGSPTESEAQSEATKAASSGQCKPLETRARETKYEPATQGQTRGPCVASSMNFNVTVLTKDLDHPWAVEPLPSGELLVTEKTGQMRVVTQDGKVGPAITGVPKVDARGQGGLLDVALSPTFRTDRTIYWSFTEPREGGNGTSVAKGVLSRDGKSLDDVKVILHTKPTYDNNMHFGSRLAFGPDGMLYVTMGERSDLETRPQAQHLNSHFGKILRITPDGQPASGNPFAGKENALPEIWSYGHRNVQASAFDAQGQFWDIEHGPRGGDELNLVEKGKNYGWPLASYGIEYSGDVITTNEPHRKGLEQPVYYWDPVIAPSGAEFYEGNAFPEWKNSLFIGALKEMRLVRLVIEDNRVVGEEHLLKDRGQRIRDVREGADGALYLVTDGGQLLKLSPK